MGWGSSQKRLKGMNKHIESIVKLKNIDYSKFTFENIDNEVFEKRNGSCYNGIVKKQMGFETHSA